MPVVTSTPPPGGSAGSGRLDPLTAESPGSSASAGTTATPPTGAAGLPTPTLPDSSLVADPGALPKLSVHITVKSDGLIAYFGYAIRYGHPPRYQATNLASPVSVTTTGRSDGLVTQVLARAGPDASYITCTVEVNGTSTSTRTVRGAYGFTACLG